MGLTIHYHLKSTTRCKAKAIALVEKMRQLALDLPFEHVDDEVRYFGPKTCQTPIENLRGLPAFDAVLDATRHLVIPFTRWARGSSSVCVQPLEIYSFNVDPGPGSEWANFGLCIYPENVEVHYHPCRDRKFCQETDEGPKFSWKKWENWLKKNGHPSYKSPTAFEKQVKIKTHLTGWHGGGFCKTQYASDPRAGGVPNFVRCHVGMITLLDRIAELPTMKVETNDEGKYGPSHYSDDPWAEKRVYTWHPGKYDVKALVTELGEWNEMIAAMFGAMKDALGGGEVGIVGPIQEFPNFEQLEFTGQHQKNLPQFLQTMKMLADKAKVEV
ncbi:MAG: hypothetical protein M0R80_23570 [Proteobacteria bacterium]|nr:hypothetical protein [Pseudomonadota bacterium]